MSPQIESKEEVARAQAAERARAELNALRRKVEFEIGVLRDYQAEKGGPLAKLAGEVADALDSALGGNHILDRALCEAIERVES